MEDHFKKSNIYKLPAVKKWVAQGELPSVFEISTNCVRIFAKQITTMRLKLEPADILIRPQLGSLTMLEFHKAAEAIDAGHAETLRSLDSRALRKLGCANCE